MVGERLFDGVTGGILEENLPREEEASTDVRFVESIFFSVEALALALSDSLVVVMMEDKDDLCVSFDYEDSGV